MGEGPVSKVIRRLGWMAVNLSKGVRGDATVDWSLLFDKGGLMLALVYHMLSLSGACIRIVTLLRAASDTKEASACRGSVSRKI